MQRCLFQFSLLPTQGFLCIKQKKSNLKLIFDLNIEDILIKTPPICVKIYLIQFLPHEFNAHKSIVFRKLQHIILPDAEIYWCNSGKTENFKYSWYLDLKFSWKFTIRMKTQISQLHTTQVKLKIPNKNFNVFLSLS